MNEYEIPCPVCCKHIKVNLDKIKDNSVVTCKYCRRSIKLSGLKIQHKGKSSSRK